MNLGKSAALCLLMVGAPPAQAAQWLVNSGGVQVNWSSLSAQFSGVAISQPGDREGLKGLERTAWRNGYEKSGSLLQPLMLDQFGKAGGGNVQPDVAKVTGAVDEVRKSVRSLNATFFADGSVQVALEASLRAGFAAALRSSGAGSKPMGTTGGESDATGLVIRLTAAVQPSASFWLVDHSGKVLFEPAMLSEEGVSQGSMGRWFRSPGKEEISKITGENHDSLSVTEVRSGNRLVVDAQQFARLGPGALKALADGKAVLAGR